MGCEIDHSHYIHTSIYFPYKCCTAVSCGLETSAGAYNPDLFRACCTPITISVTFTLTARFSPVTSVGVRPGATCRAWPSAHSSGAGAWWRSARVSSASIYSTFNDIVTDLSQRPVRRLPAVHCRLSALFLSRSQQIAMGRAVIITTHCTTPRPAGEQPVEPLISSTCPLARRPISHA